MRSSNPSSEASPTTCCWVAGSDYSADLRNKNARVTVGDIHNCRDERLIYPLGPHVENGPVPVAHRSCAHNELYSLNARHLHKPGSVDVMLVRELSKFVRKTLFEEFSWLRVHADDIDPAAWLNKFHGGKRSRYEKELESLEDEPFGRPRDWDIESFIKVECVAKEDGVPRLIQARCGRFQAFVGPAISALEHLLMHNDRGPVPWLIKGYDIRRRNEVFENMLLAVHGDTAPGLPVGGIDFSRFDSTQTAILMHAVELNVWRHVFGRGEIYKALHRSITIRGRTMQGNHKYKIYGTRASGDPHTSIGNAFLNYFLFRFVTHKLGLTNTACIVEGDDNIYTMSLESRRLFNTRGLQLYEKLGFKVKPEVGCTYEVSFCGGHFVPFPGSSSYRFYRDPARALFKLFWTSHPNASCDKVLRQIARGKGLCLMYEYEGYPIMPHLGLLLVKWAGDVKTRFEDVQKMEMMGYDLQAVEDAHLGPTYEETMADLNDRHGIPWSMDACVRDAVSEWRGGEFKCPLLSQWMGELYPHLELA